MTTTPDAFIARLATLVPKPRTNTTIYFGVLAAHAKGRDEIVPCAESERCVRPDASWKVRALLEGLGFWTEQLPLHPARGPPDEHETIDYL